MLPDNRSSTFKYKNEFKDELMELIVPSAIILFYFYLLWVRLEIVVQKTQSVLKYFAKTKYTKARQMQKFKYQNQMTNLNLKTQKHF